MAEISVQIVKDLHQKTGAGMMHCKMLKLISVKEAARRCIDTY